MTPAELFADHGQKPRNIGKLLNATAVGDVGSIVVGDALRFYIQVVEERITAARFQVFNAAAEVAAASVLTELAVGRSLDEAMQLGPADLSQHLGGLSGDVLPAQPWGLAGLRAAIAVYRGEDQPADDELEPILCRCFGIPEQAVKESIAVMGLKSVEDIVAHTGAGSGCGTCRADMPRLLDEAAGTPPPAPPSAPKAKPIAGRIATLRHVQAVYDDRIAAGLSAQGTGLMLWDFEAGQVLIKAAPGTDLAQPAVRAAIAAFEAALKVEVPGVSGVRLA